LAKSLIALGVVIAGVAQAGVDKPKSDSPPPTTASSLKCTDCLPIQTTATIGANVSIEAGLMPPTVAMKVFGRELGNKYGVFLLTISNHSADAALIVQSIFIDYSQWSLAGCREFSKVPPPMFPSYQAASTPCQSASAEQSALRALLAFDQTWSWRNQLIRYLTTAGAIASGFVWRAGPASNFSKYVSTITGTVIPGISVAIPDDYIDRLNLLNDSGFRVNTIVPKQASAVMVAFFPLDKFLTPSLRKYFLQNPSLFFSPNLLLMEDASRTDLLSALRRVITKDQYDALAVSADSANSDGTAIKVLKVDWSKFTDPDAAENSCLTPPEQPSTADLVKRAIQAAINAQKALADARDLARQSDAETKTLLRNAQDLLTKAQNLADAVSQAAKAREDTKQAASGYVRDAHDSAVRANAAAHEASAILGRVIDALRNGTPPGPIPEPIPPPAPQNPDAALSENKARESAATAARYAAEAQTSLTNVEGLLREAQQALASPPNTPQPPFKLTVQEACELQGVLDRLSLHTIRAVVGGEMSVDVDSIPGTIQSVKFDAADDTFATAGDKMGTITGLYVSGAQVQVTTPADAEIKAESISNGSSDTSLKFKLTSKKPIPPHSVLHFTVIKKKSDGTTIASGESAYTLSYEPTLTSAKVDATGKQVTVTGTGLYDLPNEPDTKLAFKILPKSGTAIDPKTTTIKDASTAVLDLSTEAKAGEDQVEVFVGTAMKPVGQVAIK
jgi:hypothetical protein